ncbi:MAG: anti-phage defense-associated sirtuin Dsr1 [Desulfobulbus sp.]|jgi:hypothetical protein|nr:anti-phage defense-associated sirtuin Dsr1 [Desulfobulbus sp.]
MQFVCQGPTLPERLLQTHEDGRVVFFCGAGISYPARLPGFGDLVKQLYAALAITPNAVQRAAIKAGQFDTAVGLLEEDIVGRRTEAIVRRKLAGILTPDLTARNATATHEALLTLGKDREGHTRLITTNFDRLFEKVITVNSLAVERFQAPLLPVPKNRWDGLVYLHGLLSKAPTVSELDRLVISSGDFGLAYLTERWAARFVSELFRYYTVCFVGYSINDPVLRYMMDALAADRLLGESSPEMFAFGSYSKGKKTDRENEWKAKNVTPILYREHNRHAYLHKTLRVWAETYRDGVRGKERIVVECAMALPLASTKQDDFVGRLLWALSDAQGLPAKRFAELDPVPSLDWLEFLSEGRYRQTDLSRFGVQPKTGIDDELMFSPTRRPSPYDLAPLMTIVDTQAHDSRWDNVMRWLACWLLRHLDDQSLLLWLVKHGGKLHRELVNLIERRLDELAELERDGDTDKLASIRANAPKAIPGPFMRTLWRLLLSDRVQTSGQDFNLFRWSARFKDEGLTTSARLELREILMPRVSLREPFRWSPDEDDNHEPQRIRDLVEWGIVSYPDHAYSSLRDLPKDEHWKRALPALLSDFSSLLRDALDLMHELGEADKKSDRSYMSQPSISEHPQNERVPDWTVLIDLNRDAWLATAAQSPAQARLAAEHWWHAPYPLFKRLAFFAAAQGETIPHRRGLEWLLADDHWWLWSDETQREAMRLLVFLAPKLNAAELTQLEQAIVAGPPRAIFNDEIESEHWTDSRNREIWLHLAKVNDAGAILGTVGSERLAKLSAQYPKLQLAQDERDEFPLWRENIRVGDWDRWRTFVSIPRSRRGVLNYLLEHPVLDGSKQDDWRERCKTSFQATAFALCQLATTAWPTDRWRDALQAWSEEKLRAPSWRYMAPVLHRAPEELLQSLAHNFSWWLQAIAKTFKDQDDIFLALCNRVLQLEFEGDDVNVDDVVGRAINHPVGQVTEAMLRWWHRRSLEDEQGLPSELKPIFTQLCDTQIAKYRHARVSLAFHVITLFRVDRDWTTQHLLPRFNWQNSEIEARAVWEGFLSSPRPYRPLFEELKSSFLDTSRHYTALGKHNEQYASLLTFAALDPGDTFTIAELAAATRLLPTEGLRSAAQTLVRALEGAGEQRADYWKNRIVPYLHAIWPKTRHHRTPAISEGLAHLCVAAEDAFPEALRLLRPWLQPPAFPRLLVSKLHRTEICGQYPKAALDFLDLVISDQTPWSSTNLGACLAEIRSAAPTLENDRRYQRLTAYLRQHERE